MTQFVRTPENNFSALSDFPFEPRYHQWNDLRMHYIEEGPRDAPVMLLLHGMPTWSFLYRDMIPSLLASGYRCVAPDHMGFGRSDKPTDTHWYTIARHTEILTSLICELELRNTTLVCQDWGGPIGLAQAATMPERFERLVIMNTWLHHDEHRYFDAVRSWNRNWNAGGLFDREEPDIAMLMVLATGLAETDVVIPALVGGPKPELSGRAADVYAGYAAPFHGLPDEAYNGVRRFPRSIPIESYARGNAAAQTHHYKTLLGQDKPVHFIWGCADEIFPEAGGRKWAADMGATFDALEDAAHFLQDTHGREIVAVILRRIGEALPLTA